MNPPKLRKSLGRGLNALFDDAGTNADVSDAALAASDGAGPVPTSAAVRGAGGAPPSARGLAYVPISELFASPLQPRRVFDQRQIDELALSIKEKGVLQPVVVRRAGSGYEIVAGERRWRAAQLARAHQVPVLIRELNDTEVLEVALVENLQRADLTPLEEAQGYQRLIADFEHTQGALASLIGKSRGHIANMIRLLALPDGVKALLDEGRLTVGHARALLGVKSAEVIAKQIVKKGLSVRQVEALVKAHGKVSRPRKSERNAASTAKDADTRALESRLEAALGLRADITFDGKGGNLTLTYSDLEQLDELIARLTMNNAGSKTKTLSNREDKDPNVLDIEEVLAKRERRPGAVRKENNSDT